MHHTVRILAAVELRAAPFHPGVRGTFQKVDAVHAREALQVGERKDQILLDEAVDDQPVVFRIDLRDATVVTLEAEPARGDDTVKLVQRRKADRGLAACRQPLHVAANDMRLVLRRLPVGAHGDTVAEHACPFRHIRRQVFRIAGNCGTRERRAAGCCEKATARRALLGFVVHREPYHDARDLFYDPLQSGKIFPKNCRRANDFSCRSPSPLCSARRAPSSSPSRISRPAPRPAGLQCPRSRSPSPPPRIRARARSACPI